MMKVLSLHPGSKLGCQLLDSAGLRISPVFSLKYLVEGRQEGVIDGEENVWLPVHDFCNPGNVA